MSTTPAVTHDEFRAVMGSIATPVAVVSAFDRDRPHGTTVSAFMSLSKEPPMTVVSLDRSSDLLRYIDDAQQFGINVLAAHQSAIATAFARKGTDKMAELAWIVDSGLPRIDDTSGWIACDVAKMVDGGDHVLVLGDVVSLDHAPYPPLVYHQGTFGSHTPMATQNS
ncbi:flavin reductase family protein [Saccharopolyspora sp. TS4A08]|uniref:Flavin reductase family protein n=1 Tax=Saccharopolyspora ipomoeae TaxID=3042027 RepID=A0ABT6PRC1_9PSEU|nr:flavin reductase family protein [Saccharopolyspora sp. TS4A08]MDI2030550.1 flavin reductase family protein [Saccharopolyspora sp. TS4A08]